MVDSTVDSRPASSAQDAHRVGWVDGIRGAAAMFVVLHHTWLSAWPGFPRNAGPWWGGWMLYGQLAVAVFIVVSGFSLSLAPLRRGGRLSGGARRFLRRRAWRILPPYWAALVLSTIISGYLLQSNVGLHTIARGFVVHGLLLQDVTGSWYANGALWSIAIEWQIYFLFPLILLLARRRGIGTAVVSTVALVVVAQALTHLGSPFTRIDHFTPQLLALFALGILAVDLGQGDRAARLQRPLIVIGSLAIAAVVVLALIKGSVWMVSQYFTIDIVFGCGVACLMAVMSGGGLPRVRRVLASRVGLRFGLFSYSIYLLHAPILGLFGQTVLTPMHLAPLASFGVLLGLGIPVTLVICYGFHLMFEAPFLQHRDTSAIRAMPIFRAVPWLRHRLGFGPVVAPAAEVAASQELG